MDVFNASPAVTQSIRVSGEVRSKLPDILHGVIYNTEENRVPSCEVLRSFVSTLPPFLSCFLLLKIAHQSTELKEEQFSYPVIEYITSEIQQALKSNDPNHVLGGIVVIGESFLPPLCL